VPALLGGFAGCAGLFGLDYVKPNPPTIVSAEGQSGTGIRLKWTYDRRQDSSSSARSCQSNLRTVHVPGSRTSMTTTTKAKVRTEYKLPYRVRAIRSAMARRASVRQCNRLNASVRTTFAWTAEEQARCRDAPGLQGFCTVQRIEAARLSRSGTLVKLTFERPRRAMLR